MHLIYILNRLIEKNIIFNYNIIIHKVARFVKG